MRTSVRLLGMLAGATVLNIAVRLVVQKGDPVAAPTPKDEKPSLRRTMESRAVQWHCTGLTVDECAAIIDQDFGDKKVNFDLEVKKPRSLNSYEQTYNFVGVFLNIYGEVTGSHHNGVVSNFLLWEGLSGTRKLDDVNCAGLDANACCQKVKENAPDPDTHMKHIECFFSVVPPELEFVDNEMKYYIYKYNGLTYDYVEVELEEIKKLNDHAIQRMTQNVDKISRLLSGEETAYYPEMMYFAEQLAYDTRICGSAQYLAQGFDDHLTKPVDESDGEMEISGALEESLKNLKSNMSKCLMTASANHERGIITLHATADGIVVSEPTVEGPTL